MCNIEIGLGHRQSSRDKAHVATTQEKVFKKDWIFVPTETQTQFTIF